MRAHAAAWLLQKIDSRHQLFGLVAGGLHRLQGHKAQLMEDLLPEHMDVEQCLQDRVLIGEIDFAGYNWKTQS